MAATLDSVVKQLEGSGIIAPGKLENFIPPKANPKSVEELVRELVKQNHLTKFQAQQVALGKAKALIMGGYTIVDRIGAGGMGQVFKAQHRRMDRLVAIKLLPAKVTNDAEAVARFEREARAAAKLLHPNIVTAFDADQANGAHFLVMEYVEGSDLSALVKKHGPLDGGQALNYILQAARGLEFAHKKGVVHRDIKPANLLVDHEGTVKILDMGLARIETAGDAQTQAELTGSGAVMGTIDYMAPEQALGMKNVDGRADIYSLGCTLYYLLAGKCIYEGDSLIAKMLKHREAPIPALNDVQEGVPDEVQAIFAKMVAKDVGERYQTMAEVIGDLEKAIAGQSTPNNLAPPAESTDTGLTKFFQQLPKSETKQTQGATKQTAAKPAPKPTKQSAASAREPHPASAVRRLLANRSLLAGSAGVVALIGVTVGLYFAFLRGVPPSLERSRTAQGDKGSNSIGSAKGTDPKAPLADAPIDLFKHIDVTKGRRDPDGNYHWSWDSNRQSLAVNANNTASPLPIDIQVPEAYVLEATVSRVRTGVGPLTIGLRSGKQRFAVIMDETSGMRPNQVSLSGLERLDGQALKLSESARTGQLLVGNQPHKIRIEVRPDAIQVAVDGQSIVDFRGEQTRLSPPKSSTYGIDISQSDLWLAPANRWKMESLTLTPLIARPLAATSASFFNGRDLTGFQDPKRAWKVVNGELQGSITSGQCPLTSDAEYSDFELSFQMQWTAPPADATKSGSPTFAFRKYPSLASLVFTPDGVSSSAKLRAKTVPTRPNEFNEVSVQCRGKHIKIVVNGQIMVDADRDLDAKGKISWEPSSLGVTTIKDIRFVDLSGPTPANADFALDLDGKTASLEIPEIGLGGTAFTLEGWTWLRNTTPKTSANVFYGVGPFYLAVKPVRGNAQWVFNCGVAGEPVTAPPGPVVGEWLHFAAVFDGRESRLYLNGTAQGTPGASERSFSRLSPLRIGSNTRGDGDFFDGLMDEIHASKSVRYTDNFIPQRRFTADVNTLALYHCDDATGDVLTDSSSNKQHGKITSAKWVKADAPALNEPPEPKP